MTIKAIFETMALLIERHKELNRLSSKKTELIKENKTKDLSALLKEESKQFRAITKAEKSRQEAVSSFLKEKNVSTHDGSISMLLEYLPIDYHKPLLTLQEGLLREIKSLREKEALNRMLVEDSLHFIHMTLDMIQPDPEAVHYQHPGEKQADSQQGFSIFDSKA